MPRQALLAAGAVMTVAFVALALPWLTEQEPRVTSTPVPPSLYRVASMRLAPGARACVAPVVVGPRSRQVTFGIRPAAATTPPLQVTARGSGYASASTVPGGDAAGQVAAGLSPPRHDVATTVCIADTGRVPVLLDATAEPRRATTRIGNANATATVDGQRLPANVVLAVGEGRARSIVQRAGAVVDRMTRFRPAFVSDGLVGVLLVLLVVLAVAGAPWAYARALAGDERSGPTE